MNVVVSEQQKIANTVSDNDVVLAVNGVSKKFCRDFKTSLFYGMKDISKEVLALRGNKNIKLRKKEFWALQDVSFELGRGEALGLVGKNGSGKSTLLRIIAGLIKPDAGSVEVYGRVAPLIALGAGFNPVLTGRENIYTNMSILGLTKSDIDKRFDEVVDFAEIGEAIDSPVQSYSSGMAARLGFSCAIHTSPDVLLIDEVLAVGDAKFRLKCSRKLAELRKEGTSFILVSHNASAILSECGSAIYLSEGKTIKAGTSEAVIKEYEQNLFIGDFKTSENGTLFLPPKEMSESLGVDIKYVCFKDSDGGVLATPKSGQHTYLCVGCKVHEPLERIGLGVVIRDFGKQGEIVLQMSSHFDGESFRLRRGINTLLIDMPSLGLRPSFYELRIFLSQTQPHANLDVVESFKFRVGEPDGRMVLNSKNVFFQPRRWELEEMENS